jgi:hypothetical protein
MNGLCLAAAGVVLFLPLETFTLAWSHSIEKIRWEEDYRIVGNRMVIDEARIRGTGAGMEPPEGAVLRDGVWRYRPELAPLARLHLARWPGVADYELCFDGACRTVARLAGPAENTAHVDLYPCP